MDSNVLIYAHDIDAGRKHHIAKSLLQELWQDRSAVISTQVLQEVYVNVTQKIASPVSPAKARHVLSAYLAWQVELPSPESVLQASEIQERHRLSFWDAMIVLSASQGGTSVLMTEDLNHGQLVEGVRIHNPFLQATSA